MGRRSGGLKNWDEELTKPKSGFGIKLAVGICVAAFAGVAAFGLLSAKTPSETASDEAKAEAKAARVQNLIRQSDTIEKAQQAGFPDAVALYVPSCKTSFAAATAWPDLNVSQTSQIYICALQKATHLNWERRWYEADYNWLK